jgi:hypothetical protein
MQSARQCLRRLSLPGLTVGVFMKEMLLGKGNTGNFRESTHWSLESLRCVDIIVIYLVFTVWPS